MTLADINWSAPLSASSGNVSAGSVMCPTPTGSAYVVASDANFAAVGRMGGVAITNGTPPGTIAVQFTGDVPASITNLGPGPIAAVRRSSIGTLERISGSVQATDYIMGDCSADGSLTLRETSFVNPSSGGGPPTGPAGGALGGTYPNPTLNDIALSQVTGLVASLAGKQPTGSYLTSLTGDVAATGPGSATSTVAKINGASVPAAGSLVTGNVLQVSGTSANTYGPLNLAGGTNYITGRLSSGNLPSRYTPIDSNTAICWTFDEAASPWANSGNGGTLDMATGGASIGAGVSKYTGLFSSAIALDGSTVLITSDTSIGESAGDFSMSAWVKPVDVSNSSGSDILVKNYHTGNTWSSPFHCARLFITTAGGGTWSATITTGGTNHVLTMNARPYGIPLGVWSLLSMTYTKSSGLFQAYMNGTLVGSTSIGGSPAIDWGSHGPWIIGGRANDAGECLSGAVDHTLVEPGVVRSAAYYLAMFKNGLNLNDP